VTGVDPGPYDQRLAVIGMAGRFPGARTVGEFWRNIRDGHSSIQRMPEPEPDDGVPDVFGERGRITALAAVADPELFDAAFFGIRTAEADIIDPQHRLFLECCWEALETAGYDPANCPGLVGVFGGCAFPTYLTEHLAYRPDVLVRHGRVGVALANDRDALTARVSHRLDLHGPAVTVQTFSSTGLVAVHLARQSLLTGECDMALAGAVAVKFPQAAEYRGMQSSDGRCRCFDANADGSVIGNGVGIVVLKRLPDALRDGDHIYAQLIGSATNSDGGRRVGFGTPGAQGKAEVVAEALANADVGADDIGYLEAHGMATPVGDGIELASLARVFRPRAAPPCVLGSVTANVGHLEAAAGVAGLIKAVLTLYHGWIPPQVDFDTPAGPLATAADLFTVATQGRAWPPGDVPRRAGVSSFGLGGVNAHVVLEEAGERPERRPREPGEPSLLVLSGRSPAALDAAVARLRGYLAGRPDLDLGDVAYTLQAGRPAFAYRHAVTCTSVPEAVELLGQPPAADAGSGVVGHRRARPVTLVLGEDAVPGPDPATVKLWYDGVAAFRTALNDCVHLLGYEPDWRCDGTGHAFAAAARYALGRTLYQLVDPTPATAGGALARAVRGELALRDLLATGRADASAADADDPAAGTAVVEVAADGRVQVVGGGGGWGPLDTVAALWSAGIRIRWDVLHDGRQRHKVPLPTYPFQRRRHWVDRQPPRPKAPGPADMSVIAGERRA